MPELKSKSEVYEYKLVEIKRLIASDLKVNENQVSVNPLYGWPNDDDDLPNTQRDIVGFSVVVDKKGENKSTDCKHEWFDNSAFHDSEYTYRCSKCGKQQTSYVQLDVKKL